MVKKSKNKAVIVICGIFILLSALCFMQWPIMGEGGFKVGKDNGTVLMSSDTDSTQDGGVQDGDAGGETGVSSKDEIAVYLCGAVKNPGVYRLPSGSRVCDAVQAAGGLKRTASLTAVNQARQLADGEQIEFPAKNQKKNGKTDSSVSDKKAGKSAEGINADQDSKSGLVNINNADAAELMTLPGIGQSRADSIIEYRTEHGSFAGIKDIMNVTGIKDGIYQKIKDNITV